MALNGTTVQENFVSTRKRLTLRIELCSQGCISTCVKKNMTHINHDTTRVANYKADEIFVAIYVPHPKEINSEDSAISINLVHQ